MKTLILDENSAYIINTLIINELYILEFNIKNGSYSLDEEILVSEEISILNNVINMLNIK